MHQQRLKHCWNRLTDLYWSVFSYLLYSDYVLVWINEWGYLPLSSGHNWRGNFRVRVCICVSVCVCAVFFRLSLMNNEEATTSSLFGWSKDNVVWGIYAYRFSIMHTTKHPSVLAQHQKCWMNGRMLGWLVFSEFIRSHVIKDRISLSYCKWDRS